MSGNLHPASDVPGDAVLQKRHTGAIERGWWPGNRSNGENKVVCGADNSVVRYRGHNTVRPIFLFAGIHVTVVLSVSLQ